jgi:hypothetical protein
MTAFLKNPPILHTRVPETEANLKKDDATIVTNRTHAFMALYSSQGFALL